MTKEWFDVAWLQDAPIRASHTQSCFDVRINIPKSAKKRVRIATSRDVCVVLATTSKYDAAY